jgi:hypothetical protein
VLYGTKNGRLGLVDLKQTSGTILWETSSKSSACINAIYCHRITNDTYPDLIVGKEDGLIEIFAVDELDNASFRHSYVRYLSCL